MHRMDFAMARILVIDDDDTVREATASFLESEEFEVVAVADGASGVEEIKKGRFDLVVVDIFMPGMDGLETTRAIRQLDAVVPVIAVSGFMLGNWRLEMPNFDTMAAEVGAFWTLYKPFRPAVLMQTIQEALGGKPAAVSNG
jgi:CheY-like chemotaxis protein